MLRNLKISAEKPKFYSLAHFYSKRANSMAWLKIQQAAESCSPYTSSTTILLL